MNISVALILMKFHKTWEFTIIKFSKVIKTTGLKRLKHLKKQFIRTLRQAFSSICRKEKEGSRFLSKLSNRSKTQEIKIIENYLSTRLLKGIQGENLNLIIMYCLGCLRIKTLRKL
jgi:hypothetical protein